MKSVTGDSNSNFENRVYPYLGSYNKDGINFIVLFTSPKVGVVVNSNMGNSLCYKLGLFTSLWHEDEFTVYNGTVTLSNN